MATGVTAKAQIVDGDLAIRSADAFASAVDYYRSTLMQRDLLFDSSMREPSMHLAGLGGDVPDGWGAVFDSLQCRTKRATGQHIAPRIWHGLLTWSNT